MGGKKALLIPLGAAVVAASLVLAVRHSRRAARPLTTVRLSPAGVMGTECELTVVVARQDAGGARIALARAEGALRRVEAMMSDRLAGSPLSRFNAAGAGEEVPLPAELLALVRRAGEVAQRSDGAFDVTCRPLVRLWRRCARAGRLPAEKEIADARKRVGMTHLKFGAKGLTKLVEGLQIDLGGIAKGHAIDLAVRELRSIGVVAGGIVNVGGDLRCFGTGQRGAGWRVGIEHPFREGLCGTLLLKRAAVATSGDYRRHVEIAGRRYSHIVDPRTGKPVEGIHSVTVVSLPAAPRRVSAAEADAWATALSVLGPAGLERLAGQAGLEAMMVTGTAENPSIHATAGFRRLLAPGTKIELD